MLEIFIAIGIIGVTGLCIYFLYYQFRVYQQQKALIFRESKALKIIRDQNLEPLRSRFRFSQIKVKA